MTGHPRDVCPQALVPLGPSPCPQSQSEPARGRLAAAPHVLQVLGKGRDGAWAVVTPGDSVQFCPSGHCCAKGEPQPSPPSMGALTPLLHPTGAQRRGAGPCVT